LSYVPYSTICLSNLLCGKNEATIDQESVIILQYYSSLPTLHHCFYSLFRNLYYYRAGSRPLSVSWLIFQLCLSRSSLDRICRVSLPVTFVGIFCGLYLWRLIYSIPVEFLLRSYLWIMSLVVSVKSIHRLQCQYSLGIPGEITFGLYRWVLSYRYIGGDSFFGHRGCGSQYHYSVVSVGSLFSVVSVSQGFLLVVSISINVLVLLVPVN